jgi:putative acetyltransferase
VLIRRAGPNDTESIRWVHGAAFARAGYPDGPPEVVLANELRACPAYLPTLDLVAEVDGAVVGHVIATRATIGPDASPVLGLGPLGVHPDHQGQGVGSVLVRATIARADEMGEPMIVLLGDPSYYARFGFVLSSTVGIEPPDEAWVHHFQVRPGQNYDPAVRGRFAYAEPFDHL